MSASAKIVRSGATYEGKQSTAGLAYAPGISAESVGSKRLWLGQVVIPPGGRTKAHVHQHHDTAILMLDGEIHMYTGDGLAMSEVAQRGDYIFIPADCPHLAVNRTARAAVAVIARTDPNEQESVVLLPDLETKVPA